MFKGQPKGLYALAIANTGERFGYYTMLAIFLLFIQAKFGLTAAAAGQIYAIFTAVIYFTPVLGGLIADRIGYGRCVVWGISVMFAGYLALAVPTAVGTFGSLLMILALLLIAIGTGLFKGNIQVIIGNLYDNPQYRSKRDAAFSIYYMAINLGSMFAPAAATAITNAFLKGKGLIYRAEIPALAHQLFEGSISPEGTAQLEELASSMPAGFSGDLALFCSSYIDALSTSYNLGFGVACVSLIFSIAIFFACRSWFRHADVTSKQAPASRSGEAATELSTKQTRQRITALFLVFAIVIFFWMAFQQSGSSLTFFARDYTQSNVTGFVRGGFNIWILSLLVISIYTLFGTFQSGKRSGKIICGVSTAALWCVSALIYSNIEENIIVLPQEFQQFGPFFVVALTPVSIAIFGALGKRGKEPSAPKKIAMGMFVAAIGYLVMVMASSHLSSPSELRGTVSPLLVSPYYLILTYLILTVAELLLSPMGISFVTQVAPPKYKGLMMGFWYASSAIGNYLSSIPLLLWMKVPLQVNWAILLILCAISGTVMLFMLRKLEAVTA